MEIIINFIYFLRHIILQGGRKMPKITEQDQERSLQEMSCGTCRLWKVTRESYPLGICRCSRKVTAGINSCSQWESGSQGGEKMGKMKTPKTYERHDGALIAICPETLTDINVHVWCWQCSEECSFAGMTVEEIERERENAY